MLRSHKTISKTATIEGVNRDGENTMVKLNPSKFGLGIHFKDQDGNTYLKPMDMVNENVKSRLELNDGGFTIWDAEHMLAAIASFGITDLEITVVNGMPFPDYNAKKFFDAIEQNGVTTHEEKSWSANVANGRRTVVALKDGSWAELVPSPDDKFHIECVIANAELGVLGCRYTEGEDFSELAKDKPMVVANPDELPEDVKKNIIVMHEGKVVTPCVSEAEIAGHIAVDVLGSMALFGPIPNVTIRTLNPNSQTIFKLMRKHYRKLQRQLTK